jgi:hypothetical protein
MNNEIKPLFLRCTCFTEGLLVEVDKEFGSEDLIYFTYWSIGFGDPRGLSWKNRIRFCWRVLTKGKPYSDMVCLKKEQIHELIRYLNPLLKKKAVDEKKDSQIKEDFEITETPKNNEM